LLLDTAQYLASRPSDDEFPAKIVASALSESEMAALTALSLLEERGITQHHFGVYCSRRGVPLDTYENLKEIPENGRWRCEDCDEDHSVSDNSCRVEVYFTVDRDKLARFMAQSSAA